MLYGLVDLTKENRYSRKFNEIVMLKKIGMGTRIFKYADGRPTSRTPIQIAMDQHQINCSQASHRLQYQKRPSAKLRDCTYSA